MSENNFYLNVSFSRLLAQPDFWEQADNLEIYLPAADLDKYTKNDYQEAVARLRGQGRRLTLHAPFIDLQPGSPDEQIRRVTQKRFAQMFEVCEVVRPQNIVMHADYEKHKYAEIFDEWLGHSVETWQMVLAQAREVDVTIALENVFESEPRPLLKLLSALNSPRLGYCCDVGHLELFSETSYEVWLKEMRDYLVELHLHDNHGHADEHLGIGEGQIKFSEFFKTLNKYQIAPKYFTLEVYKPQIFRPSVSKIKEYL